MAMFIEIEPNIIRYPAIDPATFRSAVVAFCSAHEDLESRGHDE